MPELARETAEAAAQVGPRTRRATREPGLSPVSHTTTDNAGSAAENQQVDTTEARIPGTPDETVQGVKSPMLGGTNRYASAGAYSATVAAEGLAATVARRPRVTSMKPSSFSSVIARCAVPTATVWAAASSATVGS